MINQISMLISLLLDNRITYDKLNNNEYKFVSKIVS